MALDFSFTAGQNQWRAHVREFAERELKPHTRRWDEAQTLPRDAIRKMGTAGISA